MEIVEKINNVLQDPRKIRFVVRQFKYVPLLELERKVQIIDNPKISIVLHKGLKASIERIKNSSLDPKDFIVKRILCDEGVKLKRRRIGGKGRAFPYAHQRSKISIVVGLIETKIEDKKNEPINKEDKQVEEKINK